MRTFGGVVLLLAITASRPALAQAPLPVGPPQAAFAGGPIRLSPRAANMLRAQFNGDNVPQVPQPFRGQLDTALAGLDWKRAEAVKKALVDKDGPEGRVVGLMTLHDLLRAEMLFARNHEE